MKDQLTLFQADFPASPTAQQESDWEKKMNATYGQKCAEQFERLSQPGLWAKMFAGLLIGMEGWYSMRCSLTWKLKGTKSNRFYFQLQPSTLPIEETECGLLPTPVVQASQRNLNENGKSVSKAGQSYGISLQQLAKSRMLPTPIAEDWKGQLRSDGTASMLSGKASLGMLPTPLASDIHHAERVQKLKELGAETMASRKNGASRPNGLMDYLDFKGMLPTPVASDATTGAIIGKNDTFRETETGMPRKVNQNGTDGSVGLARLGKLGMLPTPTAQIIKHSHKKEYWDKRIENGRQQDLSMIVHGHNGLTSQLNPLFVEEMMGFPENWTLLPFLNGETNQSKPTEMP